jgi:hypothetical protein
MIDNARQQRKKALEIFYEDVCNIIEYQSVKDPVTKQTIKQEVSIYTNQPCNLTYSTTLDHAISTGTATTATQTPLLIISSDITIKAGSKIVVTKKSKTVNLNSVLTTAYKNSSKPAIYSVHQEIELELFTSWT